MAELPIHMEYLHLGNGVGRHGTRSQSSDLYPAVVDAWVHGGTCRQLCVGIDVFADIDITLDDRIEDKFMDTIIVHTQKGRLEEQLGLAELVLAHSDGLAVRHNSSPGKKDAAAGMPYWKSRAKMAPFLDIRSVSCLAMTRL
ncbi:hypothetical protein LEMLEM_LOCUS7650 [Lemmus lemmus]